MSNIKGKHTCFTGKMEQGDRDDMKAHAKKLGAIIQSSVNSKTEILVCGANVAHNSKSTKLKAAKQHGAEILDEDAYYALIK